MKKSSLLACLLGMGLNVYAQKADVPVATGQFSPEWESLDAWECPEWFKDAKFGIWAHWGPQCHAEAGDWYARFMYYDGSGQNNYHWNTFGDPAEFGLKELCNDWKAQNWDPERLVNLYKSVGARYFMALGNHHDNFDLWQSPYQEWNSVNIGPKKDLAKGWNEACKKAGLPFGISFHASHAWTWLEASQLYDGNLTKEDGVGKWWEGLDPQELYAQNHEHSTGWMDSGTIHSQWDWNNGASLPSEEYKKKFQNRVLQFINDYQPDMIYFDDTAMPFYGCDDEIGKNILAHYYNWSAAQNNGAAEVVVTGKQLNSAQKRHMLWDVERGIPDRIQEQYWQTCTCIGSWHYDKGVYNNNWYKSAQQVVCMLVDIVSKNGNLLLSVPVRSDGTIDDKEEKILADIKAWMDINSSSIYGTRPWKVCGEGPMVESSNPLSAQGFNEGNNYSEKDVRYVQRNDTLYATILRWPSNASFTFKCLGKASEHYNGKVKRIELLGYGDVEYTENVTGLTVVLPTERPNDIAPVFQITFVEGTDTQVSLKEVIDGYELLLEDLSKQVSSNTGKIKNKSLNKFKDILENAQGYINDSESNQKIIISQLNEAYNELISKGRNQASTPAEGYEEDLTTNMLVEATAFSSVDMGSRFGTPMYWTVENFYVPQNNESKGVKNGIDAYTGSNCLSLGVWGSEDQQPYTCDLSNARIYKKVHLKPGSYYFGHKMESSYNLSDNAYIFVANSILTTGQIEENSIAFAQINGSEKGKFYGISFYLEEEQDVVLGFQADLTRAENMEFRTQEVTLLYYGTMNTDALFNLIERAWSILDEAKIGGNTGFYTQKAANALRAAIQTAEESLDLEMEQIEKAYENLQQALGDFEKNGKNIGGAPMGGNYEDITIEVFQEAKDFARTDETKDLGRFGAPQHWTVENFGFDNQAGLDNYPGYECLQLEVWWNSNAFAENGYDIANARIYQQAELPAGRYFFGASYPGYEPNNESYIFVSEEIVSTDQLSSQSIAYEKVNLAPRDAETFRGVFFTLEEPTTVYMGFQADFSNSITNNIRVKEIKLLYYGEITHAKLEALIQNIEEELNGIIVNENTGYYSKDAYDKFMTIMAEAKAVDASADYNIVAEAYNTLSDAYADFITNGRNPGGQPEKLNAVDITLDKLYEASDFARADETVTTRFAAPKYWTVENFSIPNGGNGTKQGLDNYPGYNCLSLGLWDDRDNNEVGDLANARIYQQVELEAGRYYFGSMFNTRYNLHRAYIFASAEPIATSDMEKNSIAWLNITSGGDDNTLNGIYFTLDKPMTICLGFQADLANGSVQQEFRANQIALYSWQKGTAIEEISTDADINAPVEIYSLQGIRLNNEPERGIFIVKKGQKVVKKMK